MASRGTPTAERLPRGRHGLTRQEVAESQRDRMLLAMAEAVSEKGYVNTPVAEVLRRAGVSRETFYEHFANKEECFLASYDAAASILLGAMAEGLGPSGGETDLAKRLDALLSSYFTVLSRDPSVARTFFVEVYAAGDAALARRVDVQRRFVDALADTVGARTKEQRFACEALVAAVSALVTQRVCAGRTESLMELHAPVVRHMRTVLCGCGLLAA